VLATAIFINVANLRDNKDKTPQKEQIIITIPPQQQSQKEVLQPTKAECKKTVGPVNIAYPNEGDIVTDNPLEVRIELDQSGDYCAVVWSYRINGGRWSDYDDKSLALYNLPNGQKTLELRVKSVASGVEKVLKRSFDYQGTEAQATAAPSISPTAAQ
jgi:hypothetical protein